ncbi:MAG: ATP-binding protein [Steroidobacteraceae bacterium]|jgi:nitrogen fixation/metabolism regulation signal transduction histidine kinase|nr:ATP-binding protein [Steroidobacteraceae bacterium]
MDAPAQGHPARARAAAPRRLPFQRRVLLLALGGGLPAVAFVIVVLARLDWPASMRLALALVVTGCWIGCAIALSRAIVEPLRSLANLLESLAAGDFSVRGRHPRRGDALGDVVIEANRLATTLRGQRFAALEATALLDKVLAEIEVAVLAFDGEDRIRIANPAAGTLLRRRPEALLGLHAGEAGLAALLAGPACSNELHEFPARAGRWQVQRTVFREGGEPFRLLVVTDLSEALREEERRAWRRLIRVIWHELNNSLAPIKSVIETARDALAGGPLEAEERQDLAQALSLMADRSEALRRFLSRYSELARLPAPRLADCDVPALLERVAAVQPSGRVCVEAPPGLELRADPDQLEQALINLVRNAVEATPEGGPPVVLSAAPASGQVVFEVLDAGSGVANPDNLFVPFFTTKPGGSGIGLVLARQVAEGHGGTVSLANRGDRPGCRARLVIPG